MSNQTSFQSAALPRVGRRPRSQCTPKSSDPTGWAIPTNAFVKSRRYVVPEFLAPTTFSYRCDGRWCKFQQRLGRDRAFRLM